MRISTLLLAASLAWLASPAFGQGAQMKIVIAFPPGGPVDLAPTRHPLLPDVPTLDEQGIHGVESNNWYALFAPAKTPPARIEQLNAAVRRALAAEPVHSRLVDSGAEPKPGSPAELAALAKSDLAKWSKLIADKKIKSE